MAFQWEIVNGEPSLSIDFNFWAFADDQSGVPLSNDCQGFIHIDIKCNKLQNGNHQKTISQIESALKERCPNLIKEVSKKYSKVLSANEISYMIANSLFEKSADVDSIETDKERECRLENEHQKVKKFFDKISDKTLSGRG